MTVRIAPELLTKDAARDKKSAAQEAEIGQLKEQLTELHAVLITLRDKDQLVAQR